MLSPMASRSLPEQLRQNGQMSLSAWCEEIKLHNIKQGGGIGRKHDEKSGGRKWKNEEMKRMKKSVAGNEEMRKVKHEVRNER